MTGKIFISYRRTDESGHAGRLFDALQQTFGADRLFIDVDSIGWIDSLDKQGARRLDNPKDFVRIEIEAALEKQKRVIPVLIGDAIMPTAEELPETLKPLATRNAVRVTHERFRSDSERLITALRKIVTLSTSARENESFIAPSKSLVASSNSRIYSLKFVSGAVAVVLLAVWAFSMGLEFPGWHAPQPENPPIVVRVCKSEQASDCPPYDIAVGCKDPNTGVDDIRDTCKSLKVKQTFTGSGGSCGVNVFAFTCLPK